jgi:hypothetical protein
VLSLQRNKRNPIEPLFNVPEGLTRNMSLCENVDTKMSWGEYLRASTIPETNQGGGEEYM